MKTKKRFLSVLLALVMLLSFVPVPGTTAHADSTRNITISMSSQGWSNSQEATSASDSSNTVSVSFSKAGGTTKPTYYNSGSSVRLYPNNTMTVSASSTISAISISFGSGDGSNSIDVNTGALNGGSWSGSATSVTFTVGGHSGHRRISSLTVTVAAPSHTHSFTYTQGTGNAQNTVTATCTEGCPDGYDTTGITLTISAPANLECDGNAKEAAISGEIPGGSGLPDPSNITYNPGGSTAPSTPGDYTASFTWGGANASVNFTLTAPAHTHNWNYLSDQISIVAYCQSPTCPDDYNMAYNYITLTISAPANLECDGSAKEAAISGEIPGGSGLPDPSNITYNPGGSTAPSTPGDYTASFSWGGKTVSVSFTLTAPAHTHSFTYSASGATITATCGAAGCDLDDGTEQHKHAVTLTIVKPTLTTYGQTGEGISASATLTGLTDFNTATGLNVQTSSIVYWNAKIEEGVYKTDGDQPLTAAPTSAGNYLAKITVNNCIAAVGYTINKADPTAPTDLTATYGQKLSDVALPTGWTWADSTQSVGNVVSPAATFKANFAGNDNYNAASNVDVAVTVSKANATDVMKAAAVSLKATKDQTATVSYTLPEGTTYGAVTNENTAYFTVDTSNGLTLTAAKNWTADEWGEGTKTFTVAMSGTNYNDYTLTVTVTPTYKQAQTITASDVTATYGDTGKKIEATTTGDGALSYAVKSGDAVTVDDSGNLTILKAGAAVVTVTAAETATYAQATKDVNVTVNTKAMTVSAPDVIATVDGQPHGISVNVTEPTTGYTVKYGTEAGSYTLDASPTQTEVGEKTVYYQVTADNYTTYTGSAKVTVNAKQTQTITAEDVTATYGDTGKKIEASTTGDGALSYAVKSGDAVTVDGSGNLTILKAGAAVVTVTAAETATYAQSTKDVNVTVNTKAMTVSAADVNVTVDGQAHGITVNMTDPASGATVKYGTEAGSYTLDASPTQTEAGEKTVYYQVMADNYTTYTGSAKVTVNAKQTQTITAEDVTAAYGDTDKSVSATTDGDGAISYAVKEGSGDYIEVNASTGALTIKAVPADGKAYVIVTAAETAAYAQATKEVTVTISKANAVAATVTANNRTYDGTEKPLVTVTGEATGGTMQYALGTATVATEQYTASIPTATDAGTYYVWYMVQGDGDHLNSAAACVTVTVSALTIAPAEVPTSEVVEVDGVKYPVDPVTGAIQIPDSSSARIIETFGYSNGGDAHTTYPTSLKVWVVTENANGERTAVRVPELDDIMQYSGFSIRVTGNRGIRMITSVPTDKKNALIAAAGLAGFTLEEYGTVVGWTDALNGASLTMDNALGHAYAYKRGAGDAVFKTSGGSTQYTNVLVKFTDEQVGKDLTMRSYMVLSKAGVRYTLYGGSVQRSIGYVAYQNRAAFRPGTAPYEYVWSLIHIAYGNRYDGEYQH